MAWPNKEFLKLIKDREIVADINDSVGKGWFSLVSQMFDELLIAGWDKHLSQIKEKFGALRVYVSDSNPEIQKIIRKYEELSVTICEHCGKPGKIVNDNYWMKTSCPEHTSTKSREWGD